MSTPFLCPKIDSERCDMLNSIVTNRLHFDPITRVLVTIEWYQPAKVPNPTEYEMNSCPATFRCYSCLERKGKHYFGGLILNKRICRECYPYLDEATVGAIIWFDMRHGFKVD